MAVWVGPERDSDGQPTTLHVAYAAGHHVSEAEVPSRFLLRRSGLPYVIENVPGSPLIDPVILCGTMFARELYRHRLFEANFPIAVPPHPEHTMPASKAGHWTPGTVMSVAGHFAPVAKGRAIMGIDWMNRAEMGEAIPPYYTEHVGAYLMAEVNARREARAA